MAPVLATPSASSHRAFIDAQLCLERNGTAICQDVVDLHGFYGANSSAKRFLTQLRRKKPEQFDHLSFTSGEKMQVGYGEVAPNRAPGAECGAYSDCQ